MLRRITILVLILALLPILIVAQQKALLKPGGKTVYLNSDQDLREVLDRDVVKTIQKSNIKTSAKYFNVKLPENVNLGTNGLADTLNYRDLGYTFSNSLILTPQDYGIQWFELPYDCNIKAAGLNIGATTEGVTMEVKIVKSNWTKAQLLAVGTVNHGYFPGSGPVGRVAFPEEATGDYVPLVEGETFPWVDIWSDGGTGAPATPTADQKYQWIAMDLLGFEPEMKAGDIVGIVYKHTGQEGIGGRRFDVGCFYSTDLPPFSFWKFYAAGRASTEALFDTAGTGWWSREYTWDMALAIEITQDIGPSIEDITIMPGATLSQDAQVIEANVVDTNPSGGTFGIKSVTLQYKLNADTIWVDVPMTASGDLYSASIPGQTPGTQITYRIKAVDVADLESFSPSLKYRIFAAETDNLLVLNNFTKPTGYPQSYYFGIDDFTDYNVLDWPHDVWAYGPLTKELVDNYTNIFEIANGAPANYNEDVIRPWIEANGAHNYFLAGQEWLGAKYNYVNQGYTAGTFEYDILGFDSLYNDVSYANDAGHLDPLRLFAQQGSTLGGALYTKFTAGRTDSLCYNPTFELGGDAQNWADAVVVRQDAGVEVDITLETRGFNNEPVVRILPCATHRVLTAGNKIAFMSFDPISVNTRPPSSNPDYYWFGFSEVAPQVEAVKWFGIATDVENKGITPYEYKLAQNYPNPFNPSTRISYSIADRNNVRIKIFDMLGREVTTLVNEVKDPGNYEVVFNASNLASGLYFYSLTTGNFTSTKKMMLLK